MGGIMVQRMILRTQDRCIYEIEDNALKFYLMIPNSKEVFLTIGLFGEVTDESIQNIIQDKDRVIVIPVIPQNILLSLEENGEENFSYLDKTLSHLINLSHQILVYNHIDVLECVYFGSDSFPKFLNWFIQKYQGRVKLTNFQYASVYTAKPIPSDEQSSFDHTMTLSAAQEIQSDATIKEDEVVLDDHSLEEKTSGSLGFVSYVLLGVVAAVVSLVFLYLII